MKRAKESKINTDSDLKRKAVKRERRSEKKRNKTEERRNENKSEKQ